MIIYTREQEAHGSHSSSEKQFQSKTPLRKGMNTPYVDKYKKEPLNPFSELHSP